MTTQEKKGGCYYTGAGIILAIGAVAILCFFFLYLPIIMFYNILENTKLLAILLAPITLLYLFFLFQERKILKKQSRRA